VFGNILLKLCGVVLSGEAIRVVSVGEEQNFDIHPFCKQHVYASDTGFYAGLVTII